MWDNINQKYVSYVDGFGEDFELVNGSGYFVFVKEDVNLQFNGTLLEPEINLMLYPGYNLIGWSYAMYSPASDIADNITNCVKVAKWDVRERAYPVAGCAVAAGADLNPYSPLFLLILKQVDNVDDEKRLCIIHDMMVFVDIR